jgi:AraC-like DNA-binding protein
MGLTLAAYRTQLRLLRFIRAVDEGADNLLAASMAAGFGSYSQCHRSFLKTLGCTPRAFFGAGVVAGKGAGARVRGRMTDMFSPWAGTDGTPSGDREPSHS